MVQSVGQNYSYNYPYYFQDENSQRISRGNEQQRSADESAGAIFALVLASKGIELASEHASNALMKGKEYTSFDNVRKVTNYMQNNTKSPISVYFVDKNNIYDVSRKSGLTVNELNVVAEGKNAFYSDFHKVAVAPASHPSLIQHELGHAKNATNKFLKMLQKSRRYTTWIPTSLIVLNEITKRSSRNNDKTFIEKHAGILGFLAFLPTIFEEGLASARGILAAKKSLAGQNIKLGALRNNYILAWSTYLLAGIGLGIASKLSVKTGIPWQ